MWTSGLPPGDGPSGREGYETERARLATAARRQREWARAGAQRAANPRYAPDSDKNIRHGKIEGAQALGAGAAKADRATERLDAEAPDAVREPRLVIAEASRAGTSWSSCAARWSVKAM
jgi:hypothetical protein